MTICETLANPPYTDEGRRHAERTTSRGLDMLIVTSIAEFTNQAGEALASNTETMIFTALEPP
ncbi:MAG TPA: hypothetical protein VNF47_28950 [Streptosporangiaceae bacterium]|nr:hypothetical protein [Streptosporangiaceae bacterium]